MTTGFFPILTETNIAAAGSTITDAYQVSKVNNEIATASAGQGVRLPASQPGREINIANNSGQVVFVYPFTDAENINQYPAGEPYPLDNQSNIKFIGLDTSRWYTMGVLGPQGTQGVSVTSASIQPGGTVAGAFLHLNLHDYLVGSDTDFNAGNVQAPYINSANLETLSGTVAGVDLHFNVFDPANNSNSDLSVGNIQAPYINGASLQAVSGTVNGVDLHLNSFNPADQSNTDWNLGNIQAPYYNSASLVTGTSAGAELHFNLFDPSSQANTDVNLGNVTGPQGVPGPISSVAISSNSGDISVVSGSPITDAGTIDLALANTNVSPGSYTAPNITIDAKGRITAATNGVAGFVATATSALDMANHRINNILDPSSAQDAATKAYVDAKPSGFVATATADLNMSGFQITNSNNSGQLNLTVGAFGHNSTLILRQQDIYLLINATGQTGMTVSATEIDQQVSGVRVTSMTQASVTLGNSSDPSGFSIALFGQVNLPTGSTLLFNSVPFVPPKTGTTAQRPSSPSTGQMYFDTTLSKPIWWKGSNWGDATGATV